MEPIAFKCLQIICNIEQYYEVFHWRQKSQFQILEKALNCDTMVDLLYSETSCPGHSSLLCNWDAVSLFTICAVLSQQQLRLAGWPGNFSALPCTDKTHLVAVVCRTLGFALWKQSFPGHRILFLQKRLFIGGPASVLQWGARICLTINQYILIVLHGS